MEEDNGLANQIRTLARWKEILCIRLIAILALIGAMVIFGFVMYNPTTMALWGASLYAVGVFWPLVVLYFKKA